MIRNGVFDQKTVERIKNLSDEERINFVQEDRFVFYPKAYEFFQKAEELLTLPDLIRPYSIFLVGPSNNGKTALATHFCRVHEPYEDPEDIKMPVVYLQVPSKLSVRTFLDSIFEKVGVECKKSDSTSIKYVNAKQCLREADARLVIIDKVENVLSGTKNEQREFLNLVKNLMNELKRPFILVGEPEIWEYVNVIDQQFAMRFYPWVLPLWKFNEDYLRFLREFERALPLRKQSGLAGNERIASEILEASGGHLGAIVSTIKELAVLAIKTGREKVDERVMDVYLKRLEH